LLDIFLRTLSETCSCGLDILWNYCSSRANCRNSQSTFFIRIAVEIMQSRLQWRFLLTLLLGTRRKRARIFRLSGSFLRCAIFLWHHFARLCGKTERRAVRSVNFQCDSRDSRNNKQYYLRPMHMHYARRALILLRDFIICIVH